MACSWITASNSGGALAERRRTTSRNLSGLRAPVLSYLSSVGAAFIRNVNGHRVALGHSYAQSRAGRRGGRRGGSGWGVDRQAGQGGEGRNWTAAALQGRYSNTRLEKEVHNEGQGMVGALKAGSSVPKCSTSAAQGCRTAYPAKERYLSYKTYSSRIAKRKNTEKNHHNNIEVSQLQHFFKPLGAP